MEDYGGDAYTYVCQTCEEDGSNCDPIVETPIGSLEPPTPPRTPDGQFEEQLEAEGVTILNSTTYFPASKQTVTWKSKTPAEIAQEKGYFTKVVSNYGDNYNNFPSTYELCECERALVGL